MVIFHSYVSSPEGNIINIISHSHSGEDGESSAQHIFFWDNQHSYGP